MSTTKTFAVTGVSTLGQSTKIRFANDTMRIKILAKNGHVNVELIQLPREMTKAEIGQHLIDIEFGKGTPEVLAAVNDVVRRNPLAQLPVTAPTVTQEATSEALV
jgi:hypothetical protein